MEYCQPHRSATAGYLHLAGRPGRLRAAGDLAGLLIGGKGVRAAPSPGPWCCADGCLREAGVGQPAVESGCSAACSEAVDGMQPALMANKVRSAG
jgi:hypothetical protein